MHAVEVRSEFVHHLAGEEEGRGGCQEHKLVMHFDTGRAGHVVKRSGITADIVGRVGADQVLIVGAAVVDNVPCGGDLPGGGVVGGLIAVNDIIAKPNFDVTAHLVDVLTLFLLVGADQDFVATQDDVGWRTRIAGVLFDCALHLLPHHLFHDFHAFVLRGGLRVRRCCLLRGRAGRCGLRGSTLC